MIKTFRGLLADGGVDKIRLSTKKGKIGYRIKRLDVIQEKPGTQNAESIVTINKIDFTPLDTIDLSNGNILGVAFYGGPQVATAYPIQQVIIFDQEVFNQDIYIGAQDIAGEASKTNYYLELETINMNDNATAVSTLRDIRLNPQVGA